MRFIESVQKRSLYDLNKIKSECYIECSKENVASTT